MRSLKPGERIDIAATAHTLVLNARNADFLDRAIGAVLVPLCAAGTIIPAFPPLLGGAQNACPGACPGLVARTDNGLDIELHRLPASVERVMVILYVVGGRATGTSLADLGELVTDIGSDLRFAVDLSRRMESALILCEFYRRGDGWRIAANGQGFTGGIFAINQALGLDLVVPDSELVDPVRSGSGDPDDFSVRSERPSPGTSSSGSGFAVAPTLIVTNYHVIEHARSIAATGDQRAGLATVMAIDPKNDIALLQLDHASSAVARFRSDFEIELGEDVIVGGFALQGLLGTGPQISGGNISALTGMHGDSSVLTFNAPIGSGNSGGPVLDAGGMVVGLVCSVLRTDLGRDTIVQNVNFGVKAALVRSFLHAAGVRPQVADLAPRSRADVAREARSYLYRINVDY